MKRKEALAIHLVHTTRANRGVRMLEALGLFMAGCLILFGVFCVDSMILLMLNSLRPINETAQTILALVPVGLIVAANFRYGRAFRATLPAQQRQFLTVVLSGPVLIQEGLRTFALAKDPSLLDAESCVTILLYLLAHDVPTPEPELRALLKPDRDAELVIRQLLTFEGVLRLHTKPPCLSLTPTFRQELAAVSRKAREDRD